MSGADASAERAYAEAVEQLPKRAARRDRWGDRTTFWTAVRFGITEIRAEGWPVAAERWTRLWEIARNEHLAPIPGMPEVDNPPATASVAERGIAHARGIIGKRR